MTQVPQAEGSTTSAGRTHKLREIAALFLRLGFTAYGGPAVHVAIMEDEVVVRRKWLSREKFLDLFGAANLIPGPTSTEMAIYIGYLRAGFAGLLLSGVCFILPAAIMAGVIAWAYVRYGGLPQVSGIFYGIKPVVIAIVFQALWRLGRSALKTRFLMAVAAVATVLGLAGVNILVILFGSALFVALARGITRRKEMTLPALLLSAIQAPATQVAAMAAPYGLWPLFLVFLKIGAILFGSGYVLLAFLRADLVERLHWLTESQLLDAVAVGQVTPGPVFNTATFIGYLLGGATGAVVATVAIFLPGFLYVGISGPLIGRLRSSRVAGAALDGVNVGALALMAAVTWHLGNTAVVDAPTRVLLFASILLLARYRLNATWLVLGGALGGLLIFYAQGRL